jgi:hypothetical protein
MISSKCSIGAILLLFAVTASAATTFWPSPNPNTQYQNGPIGNMFPAPNPNTQYQNGPIGPGNMFPQPKVLQCPPTTPTGSNPTFSPFNPTNSGYELVFDSEFNDFNDFDMTCNAQPTSGGCADPQGKNWYVNAWTFPNNVNKLADYTITNGVLAIAQDQHTGNWAISSMGPNAGASHGAASWQQNWNGTLFTGGWYVEGRISGEWQDGSGNVVAAPSAAGWHPSIWSYASDNLNSGPGLWPGQGAGYFHFAENDMMDGFQATAFYQTNLIDWNGTGPTVTNAAIIPSTITFNQVNITNFGFSSNFTNRHSFHVYGQLWVAATSTSQGYIQNYFDGVPTSKFTWNLYNSATAPPPTGQNIANIIDVDHMSVNLGNDPTSGTISAANPTSWIFADWVHVWQLPAAAAASGNVAISPQPNFTGPVGSWQCGGGTGNAP